MPASWQVAVAATSLVPTHHEMDEGKREDDGRRTQQPSMKLVCLQHLANYTTCVVFENSQQFELKLHVCPLGNSERDEPHRLHPVG